MSVEMKSGFSSQKSWGPSDGINPGGYVHLFFAFTLKKPFNWEFNIITQQECIQLGEVDLHSQY